MEAEIIGRIPNAELEKEYNKIKEWLSKHELQINEQGKIISKKEGRFITIPELIYEYNVKAGFYE